MNELLTELDDHDRAELEDLARLPHWLPRQPSEVLLSYGARVLQFLLAFSVTAPLTDDDLELAAHVSMYAVAARDISPQALANLHACRLLIASILAGRAKERATLPASIPPIHIDLPNEGPMAKLRPRPLAQPPNGQKVEVQF